MKKDQIAKLESEAQQLKDPAQLDVIEKKKVAVQERINALERPIQERRYELHCYHHQAHLYVIRM